MTERCLAARTSIHLAYTSASCFWSSIRLPNPAKLFCSEARNLVAFTRLVDSSRFRFGGVLELLGGVPDAACVFVRAAWALSELTCDSSALCWAVSAIGMSY